MREKVVGTTFVEQKSIQDLKGEYREDGTQGVPEFHTQALLVPEPQNPHDATAVAVVIGTKSDEPHRVGYLSRNSELKSKISGITPMDLVIYGYSTIGLSDSYVLYDDESKQESKQ